LVKNVAYTGYTRQVFLKFSVSGVSSAYQKVTLRLFGSRDPSTTIVTTTNDSAYGVSSDAWTETGLTWNNRPALASSLGSKTISGQTGTWYEWDVTSFVLTHLSAGNSVVSLAITMDAPPNPDDSYDVFNSREATTNPPQLVFSVGP